MQPLDLSTKQTSPVARQILPGWLWLVALIAGTMSLPAVMAAEQATTRFALSFDTPPEHGRLQPDIGPQGELHGGILAPGRRGDGLASTLLFRHDDIFALPRGTLAFWVRFAATAEGDFLGPYGTTPVDLYPGPPDVRVTFTGRRPDPQKAGEFLPDSLSVRVRHGFTPNYSHYEIDEIIEAKDIGLAPGNWLHVAWSWQGVRHRLFVNGQPVAEKDFVSPLPPRQRQMLRLHGGGGTTLDELAVYDFPFTDAEALAAAAPDGPFPCLPTGAHGPVADALWGPGEQRLHVRVDAGNDLLARLVTTEIRAVKAPDKVIGKRTLGNWRDGFAQTVLPVAMGQHAVGTFHAEIELQDAAGKRLAALTTTPYTVPENDWLGNQRGVTEAVQPPWTPIKATGKTLSVWGRDYQLDGGYGLPVQIVSQGENMLAEPVSLALVAADGTVWPVVKPSVRVVSVKPHEARWEGRAEAGPLVIRVRGRLEYDGMLLLHLELSPADPRTPAGLRSAQLLTTLPDQRARFMNSSTDQGYWWYPKTPRVPSQPGVFFDNLQYAGIAKTKFLFYALFSDHDRALEWFADRPENWQVDWSRPIQEMARLEDGTVRLTCHLANQPWTLAAPSGEITFGYMATPVKPLPADWRGLYVHYYPIIAWRQDDGSIGPLVDGRPLWWIWSDGNAQRGNVFSLFPADPAGWRARYAPDPATLPQFLQDFEFVRKRRIAPFTNQHVLIPSPRHGGFSPEGWSYLHQMLQMETANDGWTAMPTRGLRDYWADSFDRWLKAGGVQGIYIDEANTQTASAHLLSGSGYLKPDGTHGVGHNTLGMREQLKRVRQLFLDNGLEPLVWIPMYRKYIPHAFSFVDVVSEGEAFMYNTPEDPDFIDTWANEEGAGYDWSVGLARAQKFGAVPVFLNYLKYFNDHAAYIRGSEAMVAWLSQLDIIPYNVTLGYWFQARQAFGITAAEVVFHPFWEQQAILALAAPEQRIKVGYYRAPGRALVYVSNLGEAPFDGRLRLDFQALELPATATVTELLPRWDLESQITSLDMRARPPEFRPLEVGADGQVQLSEIARHSFRIVRIDSDSRQTSETRP